MTLRHFKIFIAVCREKSMTKAAEKLYMTQPSVTQAVKELEEHYGCNLFERTGKRIAINKNGYKLLPLALKCEKIFEEIEATMREEAGKIELKIGASVTVGTYFFNDILTRIGKEKNIDVKFRIDNTKKIEKMILDSEIDIAVVEGEVSSKYMKIIPLFEDELVFVCSRDNELAKYKKISINELKNRRFILREDGSGTKAMIESILRENSIEIEPAGMVNSIEAIKNLVEADFGVSILPKVSIGEKEAKERLTVIQLENIELKRVFKLIYHKEKTIDKEFEKIINIISGLV